MPRSATKDPARIAHTTLIILCGLLLLMPLFFVSQIGLHLLGLPEFNAFGRDGQNLLANTPTVSLVAPFIRIPLLILTVILLFRTPQGAAACFVLATVVHLVSWVSILTNTYFTLPTGYITLALEAAALYLFVRYPALRTPRPATGPRETQTG